MISYQEIMITIRELYTMLLDNENLFKKGEIMDLGDGYTLWKNPIRADDRENPMSPINGADWFRLKSERSPRLNIIWHWKGLPNIVYKKDKPNREELIELFTMWIAKIAGVIAEEYKTGD